MSEELFLERLKLNSNNRLFKSYDQELTFKEFKSFVAEIRHNLKQLDLSSGSLILVDIRNPFYFAGYVFACMSLNLRPALLNYFFKAPQVAELLKNNTYSLFISDQIHSGFETLHVDSTQPPILTRSEDFTIPIDSEILFFTSGSIKSKACLLTLRNFFYNALGSSENIPLESSNTWGLCLPLFHVGGFSIIVRAILAEASVVFLDNNKLIEQIKQFNASHISLVSTQFIRSLEQLPQTPLQHILLGGSAIPENYLKRAVDLELPIYKSYGMTEMASQVCTTSLLKKPTQFDCSGKILKYRELKIENQKIFLRGPCLFKGYIENNLLKTPFDIDGWFSTGDNGELSEYGLKVLGRADRIFQSGGENISPEIIEQELLKINGVTRAYVCPENDHEYGLRPIAYVEMSENLNAESLQRTLEKKLSGLFRPKSIKSWNELPKTSWKM